MFSTIFGLSARLLPWIPYRYQGNGWSESQRIEETAHSNTDWVLITKTWRQNQWRTHGVSGSNPIEPEKNRYRKMMLFPKALFQQKFYKNRLKLNFSIEFSSIISKLSQNFRKQLRFNSKCAKIKSGVLKFFEK